MLCVSYLLVGNDQLKCRDTIEDNDGQEIPVSGRWEGDAREVHAGYGDGGR